METAFRDTYSDIVEEEILKIVSNAGSDILSDDTAIKTLQNVQKTSKNIAEQMAAAEKTEKRKGRIAGRDARGAAVRRPGADHDGDHDQFREQDHDAEQTGDPGVLQRAEHAGQFRLRQ